MGISQALNKLGYFFDEKMQEKKQTMNQAITIENTETWKLIDKYQYETGKELLDDLGSKGYRISDWIYRYC